MKRIILYLFTLIVLGSCSSKKTVQTPPINDEKPVRSVQIATKDGTPKNLKDSIKTDKNTTPSVIVSFQRTTCFGKCPAFKIQLFSDGNARYEGYAYVEKKGVFNTSVDISFIDKIFNKSLEIKFWEMQDMYPTDAVEIADIPKTITFLKIGKESKKITDNFDAPKELIAFEKWLEQTFDALNWQSAKD